MELELVWNPTTWLWFMQVFLKREMRLWDSWQCWGNFEDPSAWPTMVISAAQCRLQGLTMFGFSGFKRICCNKPWGTSKMCWDLAFESFLAQNLNVGDWRFSKISTFTGVQSHCDLNIITLTHWIHDSKNCSPRCFLVESLNLFRNNWTNCFWIRSFRFPTLLMITQLLRFVADVSPVMITTFTTLPIQISQVKMFHQPVKI